MTAHAEATAPPGRLPTKVWGRVVALRPLVELEALVFEVFGVAVEDGGSALGGVAVLVDVGGDGADAGDGEIEVGDGVAELPDKGGDEAADAAIDVKPEVPGLGEFSEVCDGVDDAVGVLGGGADHHDGVVGDGVGHGVDVGAEVGAGGQPYHLHVHKLGGAVEGGVGGSGHQDFRRAIDGLVGAGPVSGGLDGEEYALGAAGGHAAGGPVAAVEEGEAKVDDLFFHPGEAGKDLGVDGVFVEVHGIGVVGDLDNVVAGVVEEAGYFAGAPVYVSPTAFGEAVLEFVPAGARLWK